MLQIIHSLQARAHLPLQLYNRNDMVAFRFCISNNNTEKKNVRVTVEMCSSTKCIFKSSFDAFSVCLCCDTKQAYYCWKRCQEKYNDTKYLQLAISCVTVVGYLPFCLHFVVPSFFFPRGKLLCAMQISVEMMRQSKQQCCIHTTATASSFLWQMQNERYNARVLWVLEYTARQEMVTLFDEIGYARLIDDIDICRLKALFLFTFSPLFVKENVIQKFSCC